MQAHACYEQINVCCVRFEHAPFCTEDTSGVNSCTLTAALTFLTCSTAGIPAVPLMMAFIVFFSASRHFLISSYIPVPVVSISLCIKDVELFMESLALREKFCISAVVE
jgi:hypothetical protein